MYVDVEEGGAHLSEALSTHHGDVGKGDGQDERGSVGCCGHGSEGLGVALQINSI